MSATAVDPEGFGRLASAFTATRENPNTRAAYTRDLAALAAGLGVPDPPADGTLLLSTDFPAIQSRLRRDQIEREVAARNDGRPP